MPDFYSLAANPKNQWGDIQWSDVWGSKSDVFGAEDPRRILREAFARIGHSNKITNPWVNYIYKNVAPGMEQMFLAERGGGGVTGSAGFAQWMEDFLRGTSNQAQRGNTWFSLDQLARVVGDLLGGRGGLADEYSQLSGDQQSQQLMQLLSAAASMSLTPLEREGLLASLAEKFSDFDTMIATGVTEPEANFLDFLARSGWYNQWFR